jgi:hypothetical protein
MDGQGIVIVKVSGTVVSFPVIDLWPCRSFKVLTCTRKIQGVEASENGWDDIVWTVAVESGNEILRCTGNYAEKEIGRSRVSIGGLTVLRSVSKSLKLLFCPSLYTCRMNPDITIVHFAVLVITVYRSVCFCRLCSILIRVKQGYNDYCAYTSCQQGW